MSIHQHPPAPLEAGLLPKRRVPDPPDSARYHRGHDHPDTSGGGSPLPRPGQARPRLTRRPTMTRNRTAPPKSRCTSICWPRTIDTRPGSAPFSASMASSAVNLMSSPGAGKTALIEATLARLGTEMRVAVIEGDIETTADADRIAPFGIPVVQINTGPFGGDCHLAAPLVAEAIGQARPARTRPADRGERGQPGVSGRVRHRRASQDRAAVGDRG